MSNESHVQIPGSPEKAYAAAAETVVLPAFLTDNSKPVLPVAVATLSKAEPAPAKAVEAVKPVQAAKPTKSATPVKVAKVVKAAKAAKPAPAKAPAPAAKITATIVKKTKSPTVKPRASKPVTNKSAASSGTSIIAKSKDTIMAKTTDFTATIKTALTDAKGALVEVKDKAMVAFEKGSAVATETTEFAKGHVEATVESGKILAEGLKTLGTGYVAEGKKALETLTADVKELAAVKSPTDFFQQQANLMRRNLEAAVAFGTKNNEAAVKLANEAFAPITARVSLAVEKLNKTA